MKDVLVVEDNESNSLLMNTILKGYRIDIVGNGKDAVEMARQKKYSVIFMDIMLPVMDGLEATMLIREFDKEVPIVAITAGVYYTSEDSTYAAGCTKYIAKPVVKKQIIKIMQDLGLE